MTVIDRLLQPTSISPLVLFRIVFGLLMFVSTIRFMANGWIERFYLTPDFHFTYYGFGWVKPLPGVWLYIVFILVALLSLSIAAGLFYRFSTITFFLLFTYTELLDKTYYLNHYYFISLLSFLLVFLPLHRDISIDTLIWPSLKRGVAPTWSLAALRLQVGLVYFFAGIAKLKYDWLVLGMPLKIWLAGNTDFPLIGWLFDLPWMAHVMSWGGAIYDLTIPFLLLYRPTRPFAYLAVIVFHLMTGILFHIGMFPYIMIACTLIFFSTDDFRKIGRILTPIFGSKLQMPQPLNHITLPKYSLRQVCPIFVVLFLFFTFQILFPLRHWLYPGDLLWTEEGYRYAWNVMLAEKTGHVTFYVTDTQSGRSWPVFPSDHLTYQQEKQMSFQPDMILEFAHYLEDYLKLQGLSEVEVRAEAYVSLNGRPSQLLIDPTIDLTKETHSWAHKDWILREY